MVITIDGPSGAGKSTVGKLLAKRLGIAYLDTGALYRAVALAAQWDGVSDEIEPVIEAWLTRVEISTRLQGGRFSVLLGGRDVEPFIRNEEIGNLASRLSAMPAVRTFLLELQRQAGRQGDLVADGRDMGTVVFPQAEAKFFLTASPEERARRRHLELAAGDPSLTVADVLAEMDQRDRRDSGRRLSPLKPAPEAFVVDSSGLGPEAVLGVILEKIQQVPEQGK
ncbi:MAG: (d)CMP kinase [Desulfarculaceae bacterium]|jgi:cytidylate kinase